MGTCEKGHYGGRPSLGCCKRCDNGKNPPPPRDPKQAKPQGWRPPANMDPEAQFGCKGCGG
jgi:hypothetical protein